MSDFDWEEGYFKMLGHAKTAWAYSGRWQASLFATLIAWAITYIILFFAAYRLQESWLLFAIPFPMFIHWMAETILRSRSEKEFGKPEK